MLKNDYIKEIENALKLVKREVDKNIVNNEIDKAFQAINKEFKGLVGLDLDTISSLSFDSIKAIISRDNQYNAEKYIALGELLNLQGIVYSSQKDEMNKVIYFEKALQAFVQAYEEDDSVDKKYLDDAEKMIEDLRQYELTLEDDKRIFTIYELLNKFDRAEDMLFYMLKINNNSEDIIKEGLDFYKRLKEKPEEILEEGNLPLEEIEDSILQLKALGAIDKEV
ncbi:DUF6483 family protein [Clostridium paraputrificum]|uniref:DUF6483 family protein n=1 Tax=Clostridium paraputrificum TaxID=29363 RepID=UPI003D33B815